MSHEQIEELLAADALGALSPADRVALQSHLAAGCNACRSTKELFASVATQMAGTAEPVQPPPHIKGRIFAAIEKPSAPKRFWWQSQFLFALAACALLAILLPTLIKPAAVGHISELNGDVRINNRSTAANGLLREGQHLTTNATGTTEVWLSDRVLIKVKPNSNLFVRSTPNGFDVHLDRGGAISLVKTGTRYAVITPILKTKALGTGFFVETDEPNETYVCICTGHIVLSGANFSQDLEATHHKAVVTTKVNSEINARAGSLQDHTDDEVAALASHFK